VDLKEEILRRVGNGKPPRFKYWVLQKCCEWLLDNPISGEADISFIRCTLKTFAAVAEQAAMEAEQLQVNVSLPTAAAGASWRGNVPYIRLILCLVQDEGIRNAFLHRGDDLLRTQLDACNSVEVWQSTVYEMLVEKWNDPTFNPILPSSVVHEDHQQSTDCLYEKVN
jgi:hypothetical protein